MQLKIDIQEQVKERDEIQKREVELLLYPDFKRIIGSYRQKLVSYLQQIVIHLGLEEESISLKNTQNRTEEGLRDRELKAVVNPYHG